MPAMGDSVSEGTILEWHKQEGDSVSEDETIVEISTDKVDAEVPSPATGTVVKVHAAEGDTVHVGALLAEIALNGGAPSSGNGARDALPEPETEAPEAAGRGRSRSRCPRWASRSPRASSSSGPSSPATPVEEDETIVEISTDKVDAEVPAPASGVMGEILASPGDTVSVGQVIGRMQSGPNGATAGGRPEAEARRRRRPERARGGRSPTASASRRSRAASPQAEGIDVSRRHGHRPRRPDPEGRRARRRPTATAPRRPPPENATLIKGASAMLARYMDESRSIPTATSFRTLTVTVLDARRKELKAAGHKVSFTHLIAYAIARAATEQMPVMAHHFAEIDGKPHRVDDGAVNLGIAVDVEKKDGGRTLMVPVIRDAGRLSFAGFLGAFNDLIARARENKLTADDLVGANVSLTNPGGIGTIASVPRLMTGQGTIVATGADRLPAGARLDRLDDRRREGDDDDVDLRPSRHPGRRVGPVPPGRRGLPAGRARLLRVGLQGPRGAARPARRSRRRPPPPRRPRATASPPRTGSRPGEELLQAVQAAVSLVKAHRMHGHLAAKLDPLDSEPEGDPALDPEPLGLTPGADGPDPRADPAHARPGRDARRRAAAPARDLLRHDRLRDRAHLLAPPAHLAAREDRVRRLPQAARPTTRRTRCCGA